MGSRRSKAFLAELREKNIRILSRGPEVAYLQSLVADLKPFMHNADRYRTISVLVADTPETDARCFPGGTIIIFRGMLGAVQSEAALVSVLGHELSHIDHGHQLRNLKSLKLAQQTFTAPPAAMDWQRMMSNTMFLAQSFARPFRPEEESEADADAVKWTYRLGYDPREFAKLFLRMEKEGDGRTANLPVLFPHASAASGQVRGRVGSVRAVDAHRAATGPVCRPEESDSVGAAQQTPIQAVT